VQLQIPEDIETDGRLLYKNGKGEITIKLKSEQIDEKPGPIGPAVVMSTWTEFKGRTINGRYEITSQGARLGEMVYFNKNGQRYNFLDDPESYIDGSCSWITQRDKDGHRDNSLKDFR
jgi:hypothetical protein